MLSADSKSIQREASVVLDLEDSIAKISDYSKFNASVEKEVGIIKPNIFVKSTPQHSKRNTVQNRISAEKFIDNQLKQKELNQSFGNSSSNDSSSSCSSNPRSEPERKISYNFDDIETPKSRINLIKQTTRQ
jgi:hypothetical protein